MPIVVAVCEIPMTWNVAEDKVVNTFHFNVNAADAPTLSQISALLAACYDNLENHFSAHVAVGPTGTVTYYNLSQPKPRPPLQTDNLAINRTRTSGSTALPHEVALCLSYESPHIAGVNQARHRGRVYFGPLDSNDLNEGRPTAALILAVQAFGVQLLQGGSQAANWDWIVYSRVQNTGAAVLDGWVDDEFDTQRRRGLRGEVRYPWNATGPISPTSAQVPERRTFLAV